MNATDKTEALRLLSDLNESVSKYADAIRNDKRMALYATDSADKKCKNEFNTLKQRTLELARKGVGNG